MVNLAGPFSGLFQFGLDRAEGRGQPALQQTIAAVPQGFRSSIAVQLFAPTVPLHDALVDLPGENRFVRQFDEPALLGHHLFGLLSRRDVVSDGGDGVDETVGIHDGGHR